MRAAVHGFLVQGLPGSVLSVTDFRVHATSACVVGLRTVSCVFVVVKAIVEVGVCVSFFAARQCVPSSVQQQRLRGENSTEQGVHEQPAKGCVRVLLISRLIRWSLDFGR